MGRLLKGCSAATGLLINNETAAATLPSATYERGQRVSGIGRYSADFAATLSLSYSFIESAPDRLGSMAVREPRAPCAVTVGQRFISPEVVSRGSTALPRSP
ncbi:hypothetical protein ACWCOT_03565 [Nonomuraea bangladeshensis]